MPTCLVLAAGASRRMSGPHKALLEVEPGVPAVAHILRVSWTAGLPAARVVLGAQSETISPVVLAEGGTVIHNPRWDRGRTGSVKWGLREISPEGFPVLLWPVDHPWVLPRTIASLLSRAASDPSAHWWIPTYEGRGGHPVLVGLPARAEVLGYGDEEPLFRYPHEHPAVTVHMPVDDPGVLWNTDTPQAYRTARGAREVPP